jgi:hypothetical protein
MDTHLVLEHNLQFRVIFVWRRLAALSAFLLRDSDWL